MSERGNTFLKFLDYYLGIPICFVLGLFRRTRKNPFPLLKAEKKPVRVLFIKTGAVGDSILLSAIAQELKVYYSHIEITLLCTKSNEGVAFLLNAIDKHFLFSLKSPWKSIQKLQKEEKFDLSIDFGAWPRIDSLISYFSPSLYKVGFRRKQQYRHYIYDEVVLHKDTIHEIDNYRNLLHSLGIKTIGEQPKLRVDLLTKKFLKEKKKIKSQDINELINNNKKFFILHMFPGGTKKEFKMWPNKNWVALSQILLEKGYAICFTGANVDKDDADDTIKKISKTSEIVQENKVINLSGKLSWDETAWLLLKAKGLITVNTGIMHMASALGTRIIALNGPTAINRWGAIGKDVSNLTSDYTCSPCLSLGFEYACKAGGCMSKIELSSVEKWLN